MKKIILSAIVLFATIMSSAQSLEDINDMMGKFQYREAKAGIDKYLSNSKKATEAEAWYYKGRIYNALSRDSSTPASEIYNLKNEAFLAFKQNQVMDKKDVYLSLETHTSYLDLYYGLYDFGAKEFNNKNFDSAMNAFKKAMEVKDYILEKKYDYPQTVINALDTSLILNIAASAIQAKKEDIAIEYYKKITDARASGADYKEVYQYIVEYYIKKDDEASLKEILTIAKSVYPGDDYWIDAELKAVSKKGDKATLFAKYDELIAQNPSSFVLPYNYAVEIYNSLYGKDATNAGDATIGNKLTEIIKKAINNEEKTDITATSLMANHLYNMSADMLNTSNMIKSTKPDEVKRKSELKAAANKSMDDCIIYAGNVEHFFEAIPNKTPIQKANYKIALGYLSDIYSLKKNPVKIAEYEKKKAAADKL